MLLDNFTNLYPLSKTIRFELRPIGETLNNFLQSGLLEKDIHRAESYQHMKRIIDDYHKHFIERSLENFRLNLESTGKNDSLTDFYTYYSIKWRDETQRLAFSDIQAKLRKQIADCFINQDTYKRIDKKELIKEDLANFVKDPNDLALVREFEKFTTYFIGFHENRKNLYVAEEKSTAISFRLINQNLPRFIDNIEVFQKVALTPVRNSFERIYKDLYEYLRVPNLDDVFTIRYFNSVLTQAQIDIYNAVIGGTTLNNGVKTQGLNELINLYNQQQKDRTKRLPKLKPLYKQILSDRNSIAWLEQEFESDDELLDAVQSYYRDLDVEVLSNQGNGEVSLPYLLQHLSEYDLEGIYIRNDSSIISISQRLFGSWSIIGKAIAEDLRKGISQKKKESSEEYEERIAMLVKNYDSFSIGYLNRCLAQIGVLDVKVEHYFASLGSDEEEGIQTENIVVRIHKAYSMAQRLLNRPYGEGNDLAHNKNDVAIVKQLLDNIKSLQQFVKPLLGKDEGHKDAQFYGELTRLWEKLYPITPLYNKVRNRMTRKPYSNEKIKLNFENSTLLAGWDVNKEPDNSSVILRKDGYYYLCIMDKKHNRVFKSECLPQEGECFEKMEYKLLPGANKMLPKVFFSKSKIDHFAPSPTLLSNYEKGTHKKGENFNLDHCRELIDFFKSSIEKHDEWKNFEFQFSPTDSYEDLSGFYREVEQQGYKISFRNVSASYINKLVKEGKLYLFQLYNKDFSPHSKGTPNLHTLYWKMLFDEQNLKNVVYKLNGQSEVFFRKASIRPSSMIVHPAHEAINNKSSQNKVQKPQSTFSYDIVKNRRYTVDKFHLHVPITINFRSRGLININAEVNQHIKSSKDLHIIGIDRGEHHLLYLTVIDCCGNIKEQCSLNSISNSYKGKEYRINYKELLNRREKDREDARQSWLTIEGIKDLKEGYLSQVIYKISQLMLKYNAIIILEDLNLGFMKGKQKVERQMYQKFEKALIDKLNFLVVKKNKPTASGGMLKGFQLTNQIDSLQKIGRQCGFFFYIPAWNTSKMDPSTGFVNLLDVQYESVEKSKLFFSKFDSIGFNRNSGLFEFTFDYNNFTTKAEGSKTRWTICSCGERTEIFKNSSKNGELDSLEVNLTDAFREHFEKYRITISGRMKHTIVGQSEKRFFEKLYKLLRLTLQMRNNIPNSDEDYLISPVLDSNGRFFDSRYSGNHLPNNADANGAYNIARKGLWLVTQIREADDLRNLKLTVSNKEWLRFAQMELPAITSTVKQVRSTNNNTL